MQQQCQVEQTGSLDLQEERGIGLIGVGLGLPYAVEVFEAVQGVFVGGVSVIELVLDETGEGAKLGQVTAQHCGFVQGAEGGGHDAAVAEDGQEGFRCAGIALVGGIHQVDLLPDELRQVRVQVQAALLCVEKDPQQSTWFLRKHARVQGADLAPRQLEPVQLLAPGA